MKKRIRTSLLISYVIVIAVALCAGISGPNSGPSLVPIIVQLEAILHQTHAHDDEYLTSLLEIHPV